MVKIVSVGKRSRAARHGIEPGDMLVSINGHTINDVLDYRFYLADSTVELCTVRDGRELSCTIRKGEYDDIGLEFETPLMDNKHSCENKCIFCFIDQNPKGMRESIYFKDDDSRLSFLHGNYITLTNLKRHDIERIIEMHISPVNISIHTTDPELRVKMMKNKRSGQVLEYLGMLSDAGIKLRGQIVLCKGVNDKQNLDRTMNDLLKYYPQLDSVSIVPAGLTAHREGLYPLEPFTPEECAEVIKQVTDFGDMCVTGYGERIFFVSDEFYVKSGTPLPDYDFWEGFTQLEDGVGMLSSFKYEFESMLSTLDEEEKSVVAVAKRAKDVIEAGGFGVIHDTTRFDETYSGSYQRSMDAMQENLLKYPTIQITVDVHRDAFGEEDDGTRYKPVAEVNGENAAQIMIMAGCDLSEDPLFPDWRENLHLALRLQQKGDLLYPGLFRPLFFAQRNYNMHATHGSLLVEVGTEVNTQREADYAGELLGETILAVLNDIAEE